MSLEELDAALKGGARENRFRLLITLPDGVSGATSDELKVLALSTAVPGRTRGAITIQALGKTGRLAGDDVTDETFETVFQVPKESEKIYGLMKQWYELAETEEGYKSKIKVQQLDLENKSTNEWEITGAWVSTLPPIDFSRESSDTIKQFPVTFTVDKVV